VAPTIIIIIKYIGICVDPLHRPRNDDREISETTSRDENESLFRHPPERTAENYEIIFLRVVKILRFESLDSE
jgi:hypothetical protein